MLRLRNHWWGLSLYTFVIFVILDVTKWLPLRFWGATSGEHFIDTKQIINSVECLDVNTNPQSSELCKNYIYGVNLLRILKLLDVDPAMTGLLGFIFLGLLAIVFGFVSFKSGISSPIYLMVILSPPVLLLAERANFDTLMLALVVVASLLSLQGWNVASTLSLVFASAFKFYTLPLLIISALLTKKHTIQVFIIAISGVLTFQISQEMLSARKLMNPTDVVSYNNGEGFGFNIWSGYLPRFKGILPINNALAGLILSSLILIIFCAAMFALLRYNKRNVVSPTIVNIKSYQMFEYQLIVHLSCFFAGVSIDYRLVFIAGATLSYLSATEKLESGTFDRRFLIGLLIVSLWCTYPSDGLQIIGDSCLSILTLTLALQAIRYRILVRKIAIK